MPVTVPTRHLTDMEQKVWDLFRKNGVDPAHIRSESVRIEFLAGFGAVLVGETFIPVDLKDFEGEQA